jgi:hypothetical protein
MLADRCRLRTLSDDLSRDADVAPEQLWSAIEAMGGRNSWYSLWPLWHLRGALDRLVGGPGLRRGRPARAHLKVGDAVDFWRVEHVEPYRALTLRAEMRFPGTAWLELAVVPTYDGEAPTSRYIQRILFHPRGLLGVAYWYAVLPLHTWVFGDVARTMIRQASAGRTGTCDRTADRRPSPASDRATPTKTQQPQPNPPTVY